MQTMTTGGIQEAFKNLRDGKAMPASRTRALPQRERLADRHKWHARAPKRMFGSRAGNVASVGRVQTPTLAIVYARELEIRISSRAITGA